MDLLRLDTYPQRPITVSPYLTPSYLPNKLIEGWSSLVWTERYDAPGEFELKTSKVQETMNNLPQMSLLSLRESNEVMFVETLSIGNDSNGDPELTITGRSLMAMLEKRYLRGLTHDTDYNKQYLMGAAYYPSTAAAIILWNAFCNDTAYDATQATTTLNTTNTVIPNFDVSSPNVTPPAGTSHTPRLLSPGSAYDGLVKFLEDEKMGLRSIRPKGPTNWYGYKVLRFWRTTFLPEYQWVNPFTSMRLDLYYPDDRRLGTADPVVFNARLGHIKDPQYLFSNKEYTTQFFHSNIELGETDVKQSNLWGLDFKQEMKIGTPPGDDVPFASYYQWLVNDVAQELEARDYITLISGTISEDVPYTYGPDKDYYLGDIVTLYGEYGFTQDMRISEYVRTQDQTGETGYPGLRVLK